MIPSNIQYPLDMNKLEIYNLRLHVLASDPSTPVTGQPYYNSSTNKVRYWNGSAWVNVGAEFTAEDAQDAVGTILADSNTIDFTYDDGTPSITGSVRFKASPTAGSEGLLGSDSNGAFVQLGYTSTKAMRGDASLDAIASANAAAAAVTMNSQRITNVANPSADGDAVNLGTLNALLNGRKWKDSVLTVFTTNQTLSGEKTNDGVTTSTSRVLVAGQSTQAENGIYVTAAGSWTRAKDADSWTELVSAYVIVEEGTTFADSKWMCTVNAGGTLNTTAVTWMQDTGGSAYLDGDGLTLTGNTFSVNVDGTTIEINADTLRIKDAGVTTAKIADNNVTLGKLATVATQRILGRTTAGTGNVEELTVAQLKTMLGYIDPFHATIGDGAALQYDVVHSFGTTDVHVSVWTIADGQNVGCLVTRLNTATVRLNFANAPANNSIRVKVSAN